ncbi:uncharacterized protein SCHCODRAFT_02665529 [Schizophyllum commune H4-8]|uniref:uncharacterized protein n=1 Tax=Schizophyllum commune (strain H4-8 / FGSC 9210) TaxID=578458 RepID=UPI002160A0E0|nr:uncharacterized protein SCHCODRAFT_02665529 [Schizophyllum commune H4-8]KAI5895144.1 hypothetical protein SCHCODRAFT_02665529 [Schizophyllum commune H4-8]
MASSRVPNELLDLIFRDSRLERHDVTQFARVSKAWQAVATSIIWESLTGILPLIALMPEGVWSWKDSADGKLLQTCLRPLTEEDWKPVYARSCLVKDLRAYFPLQAVHAISACLPAQCLLPSLSQLHFEKYLLYDSGKMDTLSSKLLAIVTSPRFTSPALKGANFHFGVNTVRCTEAHASLLLRTLLGTWTSVRTVNIELPVYRPDLLPSLAQLPSLEVLDLSFDEVVYDLGLPPSPMLRFLSLRSLTMRAVTPDVITVLICSSRLPSLDTLIGNGLNCTHAGQLTPLMQALCRHIPHDNLRHLRLHAPRGCRVAPLRFEHLRPLAAFRRLSHVEMKTTDCTMLTDVEHAEISSWWPALEILKFTPVIFAVEAYAARSALVHYARHCPNLRKLQIPLIVHQPMQETLLDSETSTHALETLWVGQSPFKEELVEEAVRLINALFPNLVEIVYESRSSSEAWNRIKQALRYCH